SGELSNLQVALYGRIPGRAAIRRTPDAAVSHKDERAGRVKGASDGIVAEERVRPGSAAVAAHVDGLVAIDIEDVGVLWIDGEHGVRGSVIIRVRQCLQSGPGIAAVRSPVATWRHVQVEEG